ncbi:hypothetical protein NLJ89_g2453 [Agrocybe chaxingu]|uniref:Uncharacterized protein n=1 Tax=Agrocybe chaxingu TaxID=84603 RepID=A0A9W8K6U3_9AGAR|nr:hypothetical protein NLJ89_g2453 [Agrocybe chaxingu]
MLSDILTITSELSWKVSAGGPQVWELTLVVDEVTVYAGKPQQFAAIHVDDMKELSLARFELMVLEQVGKKGSKTALVCVPLETGEPGRIELHETARNNLRIKLGDRVSVRRATSDEHGKLIVVISLESRHSSVGNRIEEHLRTYFAEASRRLLPFHEGDVFVVQDNLRFKVVQTDPPGFCTATEDTRIELGLGYSDIGGCTEQIEQIRNWVEVPLLHPEAFAAVGVRPPRGVLLVGLPGIGKTRVARAVANHAGAYFIATQPSHVMSSIVGQSEERLRSAFDKAKRLKGRRAIIFINDVESIAPKRNKSSNCEFRLAVQLFTLMEDVINYSNIIVLATTNRPDLIDPALRRFGRFDREIKFTVPDTLGRLEILRIHTRAVRLADDVDLETIAAETHGYVGMDLASLCSEAATRQIHRKFVLDNPDSEGDIVDSLQVGMNDFQFALSTCLPFSLRENPVIEIPHVRWKDVGGLESTIQELREMVLFPIRHADKFKQFGMSPSTGVLLYGPPGTGKTLLAKAMASECGLNFLSVKGPELLSMWFGESEANIRKLFDQARAAAPCIVFFDELDSLAKPRGSRMGDSGASDRVLNQLLVEMDGINARKNVFVIGATNRPDQIDPALLRPGRFDRLIHIALPDEAARFSILKAILRLRPGASLTGFLAETDLQWLARKTPGFSGADLMGVCRRSLELCIQSLGEGNGVKRQWQAIAHSKDLSTITREHLEEAVRQTRGSVPEERACCSMVPFKVGPMFVQLAVVHPEAMKKMGIQQFQTILIESESGRSTALMCFSNEDCPTDKIEIHKIARENLGVTLSDTVDVRGVIQDLIAKSIFVEVLQSRSSGDTVMPALKAYFEDATQRQLPFYEGDQFVTEDGLWLKIAKMTPPAFGSVTKSTRIELVAEPIPP